MRIITHIDALRAAVKERRGGSPDHRVGFVPTMGYLHEGHQSLLNRARADNETVVLSVFVNPLQFGPNEDLDRYPRNPERDQAIAREAGVDILFMPAVEEMYPEYPLQTRIVAGNAAAQLCGASRPGHFDGVAAVVLKLFQIVQPDRAYFGLKDAQQVAVVQQLVQDFNVPVEIVPCPTVREKDGLAMSSRNVYLTQEERKQAVGLYQALEQAESAIQQGPVTARELEKLVRATIEQYPLAVIDYVSVLSFPSLRPMPDSLPVQEALRGGADNEIIVALAVKFGQTRLIDNRLFHLRKE